MADFLYSGPDLAIAWSPEKAALLEFQAWTGPGGHRWHYMGPLYAGQADTRERAVQLTGEYLQMEWGVGS